MHKSSASDRTLPEGGGPRKSISHGEPVISEIATSLTSSLQISLVISERFRGSNGLLSAANQSRHTKIPWANSPIAPRFYGQVPIKGDQRPRTRWFRGLFCGFLSKAKQLGPLCLDHIPACSMVIDEWKAMHGPFGNSGAGNSDDAIAAQCVKFVRRDAEAF